MTQTVFAEMETTGVLMGESVSIRTNSAAGRLRWAFPGREGRHKATMTAKPALMASGRRTRIIGMEPVEVADRSIWEISVKSAQSTGCRKAFETE